MIIRKRKNDYTFILFYPNGEVKQIMYIHNCFNAVKWVENSRKYFGYSYINIYLRRSREFLFRHYPNNFIPPFP